jgi:hypothetical protein
LISHPMLNLDKQNMIFYHLDEPYINMT